MRQSACELAIFDGGMGDPRVRVALYQQRVRARLLAEVREEALRGSFLDRVSRAFVSGRGRPGCPVLDAPMAVDGRLGAAG